MQIQYSFKNQQYQLQVAPNTTPKQLQQQIACACKQKSSRIRLQIDSQDTKKKYINFLNPLTDQISNNSNVVVKYIGIQINYRAVFLLEYLGPIIIWLILHHTYSLTSLMWLFHFIKREFETIAVHKFSNETMPLFNLFKNCSYYWFFAVLNAYFTKDFSSNSILQKISITLFFIFEMLNFYTHIYLRTLRPKNSTAYVNPSSILFKHVACPNYSFELLSWAAFTVYTQSFSGLAFTVFGFSQISVWANQKFIRLNSTFGKQQGYRKWRLFWFVW